MTVNRAEALRRAFDASFAMRPDEAAPGIELLGIDLGDDHVCVRVGELAAVHSAQRVRRVPGAPSTLLGLAGLRGRIVPVFDLSALLGRAPHPAPRWMVLTGTPIVGLAVANVERQQRVLEADVVVGGRSDRFMYGIAKIAPGAPPRAILDLSQIVDEIRRLTAAGAGP